MKLKILLLQTSQCRLSLLSENQRSSRVLPQFPSEPKLDIVISDFTEEVSNSKPPSQFKKKAPAPSLTFKKISKTKEPMIQIDEEVTKEMASTPGKVTPKKPQISFDKVQSLNKRLISSPLKVSPKSDQRSPKPQKLQTSPKSPPSNLNLNQKENKTQARVTTAKPLVKKPVDTLKEPKKTEASGMPVKMKVRRSELRSIQESIAENRNLFLSQLNSQCVAQIDRCLTDR